MRGLRHYADPLDLNRDCAMRFGNQNQIYVSRQLFPVTPDERLDHAGLHESACGKPEFSSNSPRAGGNATSQSTICPSARSVTLSLDSGPEPSKKRIGKSSVPPGGAENVSKARKRKMSHQRRPSAAIAVLSRLGTRLLAAHKLVRSAC